MSNEAPHSPSHRNRNAQDMYLHRQRNKRGMAQVRVWVPAPDRQKVIDYAETLRRDALREPHSG